jgi:hypothetical protein
MYGLDILKACISKNKITTLSQHKYMRKPILAFVAPLGVLFIAVSWISAATIPAGTTLVVRTIDGISSSDKAGKRFAGKLDSSLVVSGNVVVPAGSKVYGRVNNSQSAGRAFGQSQLSISLTEISVNGQLVPIVTKNSLHSGTPSGRKTVRGAGTGALIGAAFDGGNGAAKGAAIGAAASLSRPGQPVVVPGGTLLDFQLAAPISL